MIFLCASLVNHDTKSWIISKYNLYACSQTIYICFINCCVMLYGPEECKHSANQFLSKLHRLQAKFLIPRSSENLWLILVDALTLINCKAICHSFKVFDIHAVILFRLRNTLRIARSHEICCNYITTDVVLC